MADKHVCPKPQPPTDREVRKLVAEPMLRLSYAGGIDSLARDLGVNEKTVRRARDEESTVSANTVIALFWQDRAFREALLSHVGERPVILSAVCDTDALPTAAGAVHRLAVVTAESSPSGKSITDDEALECEPEIEAALASLKGLKDRIVRIKHERRVARAAS